MFLQSSRLFQLLFSLTFVYQVTYAIPFFTNATIPANLTTACANALLTDVTQCPPTAARFGNGYYYPASILEKACTSDCSTALDQYEQKVHTACISQTWAGFDDENGAPIDMIPNVMRFNRDVACIQDSGRWCNVVAAAAALKADPGQSVIGWDSSAPNVTSSGPCDLCFIKSLQKQAGSPYYYGPQLRASSVYESKTSSCKVTGYPLTTSTLPWSLPVAPTPTPSTCASKTYKITAGDDCYKISKANSIGTAWLLIDNNLAAYCSGFPTSGNLCIRNACKVYTVQSNDTCDSIATSNNITVPQLKAWNPIINAGCYNLYKMNGTSLCVSSPGEPYVSPSRLPPLAPSTASTAAPVPTNAKDESNRNCGAWYNVELGDYCNLVTMKYGISLVDFVFLNPSINANCTNLLLDISFCIKPVGDINTYSGRPGYHTPGPTGLPFTKHTFTPISSTPTPTPTAIPLAIDTRDDCYQYFDGASMHTDITGTSFRHQCDLAVSVYRVKLEELLLWNPELGNDTSAATCSFRSGARYCGKAYVDNLPPNADGPSFFFPIRDGYDTNCTQFGDVPADFTCSDVLIYYDLTIAQFFKMNPAVGSDCRNLWTQTAYCVASPNAPGQVSSSASPSAPSSSIKPGTSSSVKPGTSSSVKPGSSSSVKPGSSSSVKPGSSSSVKPGSSSSVKQSGSPTTVAASTTTKLGPSGPTQSGQPSNCILWYTVVKDDSCAAIADKYFITLDQFFAWNPTVSKDCKTNFWAGSSYCVGTADSITVTRSAPATRTSTSAFVIPAPSQANNAVSNCNKASQALNGEFCSAFADRNKVTLTQLYAWNKVLDNGNACNTQFWATYWYCIGVSA